MTSMEMVGYFTVAAKRFCGDNMSLAAAASAAAERRRPYFSKFVCIMLSKAVSVDIQEQRLRTLASTTTCRS